MAHTAVFFSTDWAFAAAAGSNVFSARLSPEAKVLDASLASSASEALRQAVAKNKLAALSAHIGDRHAWVAGWNTGEVLRFAMHEPKAAIYLARMIETATRSGLSREAAAVVIKHNTTRGLIELICSEAVKLGFDALVGNEADGPLSARRAVPWLAVFDARAITPPQASNAPMKDGSGAP